jgi:hypothetical protein
MFKKGDKVICINAGEVAGSAPSNLTLGNTYAVAEDQDSYTNVEVINDAGKSQGFFPERFGLYEEQKPKLDLTKPVETVSGEPFVLLSTEGRGAFNIVGYVGERDYVMNFNDKGEPASNHPAFKLRNVPAKPQEFEGYFNVYRDDDGTIYVGSPNDTRAEADQSADYSQTRIGCIKVKLVEGQFDE